MTAAILQQQGRRSAPPAPENDWRSRALAAGRLEIGKRYSGPVIGEPESYRWGSPGWDCSSFCSAMISQATDGAVKLTAYTDAAYDQLVPTSQPLPGDVVFYRYNDPAQPGVKYPHMGFWLSDTMVLDARYPQGVGEHPHVGRGAVLEVRTLPVGISGWPVYDGTWPTQAEIIDYITRAATLRLLNVDHVFIVVYGEGGTATPILRNTAGEPAWGPFQLHVVAEDFRPGFEDERAIALAEPWRGYVGDQFKWATGVHPSKVRGWKLAVDFALDYAVRAGSWAAWYGARGLPGGRFTPSDGRVAGLSEEAQAYAGVSL